MDRIRVAVLMGGPSSEHDVSLRSGASAVDALDRRRYEVRPVLVTREGAWRVLARPWEGPRAGKGAAGFDPLAASASWRDYDGALGALAELVAWRADVALPLLHGRFGEDGTVQACLAAAGIRFAGSGVRGSAVAIDKIRTKEVLGFHGVRTPAFLALSRDDLSRGRPALAEEVVRRLGTPVVVKDPLGGSTLEVRVCDDAREVALASEALSPPAGGGCAGWGTAASLRASRPRRPRRPYAPGPATNHRTRDRLLAARRTAGVRRPALQPTSMPGSSKPRGRTGKTL